MHNSNAEYVNSENMRKSFASGESSATTSEDSDNQDLEFLEIDESTEDDNQNPKKVIIE